MISWKLEPFRMKIEQVMNFNLKSLFWAHCEGDIKGVGNNITLKKGKKHPHLFHIRAFEKNIKWESKFGEEIKV